MSQKTFSYKRILRTGDCDVNGQWKPGAILETMQDAAGAHAELLGVGREALMKDHLVWVLSRSEVVMDRYPKLFEEIETLTFPMPPRRWFMPRYYVFYDASGNEIGRAGSLWVLVDINTRKMAAPDPIKALMPDNSDLTAPLKLPSTVTEVAGTIEAQHRLPLYTDLDLNGHVNNTRYMDWCCNALGIDTMVSNCVSHFAVNYNMEIRPHEEITTELHRLGDRFSYSGIRDGKHCFDIGGELRPR